MTTRRRPRRDAGRPRGEPIVRAVHEATLHELATRGFGQLSVERIARAAQVNKTSIYRRWPTRGALVEAALLDTMGAVTHAPDEGSLEGDLLAVLGQAAAFMGTPVGRGLLRLGLVEAGDPGVQALAASGLERQASSAARAIARRAKRRGELRAGVEGRQLVFTLIGALVHRLLLERAPATKRWVAAQVRLVVRGAAPR